MLEGAESDKNDEISPFLGTIVDVVLGNEESPDISRVYTNYCGLPLMSFRRHRNPVETDSDLLTLAKKS